MQKNNTPTSWREYGHKKSSADSSGYKTSTIFCKMKTETRVTTITVGISLSKNIGNPTPIKHPIKIELARDALCFTLTSLEQ